MKNKIEKTLEKIYYWKDKNGKYFVQFEYNDGKICDVYVVDEKKLEEIKKEYKDLVVKDD
jgi:hypothetical protein